MKLLIASALAILALVAQAQTSRAVWEARDAAGVPVAPSIRTTTQALCDSAVRALNRTQAFQCVRLVLVTASAQTPPTTPPVISPPPASSGYDVGARVAAFQARYAAARPGATFPVALPTAPAITSRITVSTAAEMQAAAGRVGVEVTFAGAGFVGTLNVGQDQRWIFPAGFTLTAPSDSYAINYSGARRVELVGTGGRVVGAMYGIGPQDLRLRGMDVRTRTNSTQTWYDMNSADQCARVLIESSYVFARSYAMIYSDCTNFVVANSEVIGAGDHATARTARSDLVLWLDSRLVTQGNQQIFRAHENTNRFAGWGLQIEGATGVYVGPAGIAGVQVQELVLLDNSMFVSGQSIAGASGGNVTMGTVVGNRAFTNFEPGSQIPVGGGAGWVIGDNPRNASAAPPAWTRR
jgi:hypothetical protein